MSSLACFAAAGRSKFKTRCAASLRRLRGYLRLLDTGSTAANAHKEQQQQLEVPIGQPIGSRKVSGQSWGDAREFDGQKLEVA